MLCWTRILLLLLLLLLTLVDCAWDKVIRITDIINKTPKHTIDALNTDAVFLELVTVLRITLFNLQFLHEDSYELSCFSLIYQLTCGWWLQMDARTICYYIRFKTARNIHASYLILCITRVFLPFFSSLMFNFTLPLAQDRSLYLIYYRNILVSNPYHEWTVHWKKIWIHIYYSTHPVGASFL